MAKKSKTKMVATLTALTTEERLIAGLDPLTDRELRIHPPASAETMQDIGISPTKLNTIVRSWINNAFRRPAQLPVLTSGAIDSSTTWATLLGLCG